MKKIAAITLVFLMLLSFCGCNSTKLTTKNLVGTWEAEFTLKDYASMTGEDITADDESELPKKYSDKIDNLKMPMRITYSKNGECVSKISKASIDKLFTDMIDIMIDYYKNEGLLLMYQTLGSTAKNNEELEAFFVENGTTTEDVLTSMEVMLLGVIEKSKEKADFGELDDNGYYIEKEKFTVAEDAITYITKDKKEEITYCELTDKNTLAVSKIYYDFEEYNVDITFKRVK